MLVRTTVVFVAIVVAAGAGLSTQDALDPGPGDRQPFSLDWWSVDGGGGPASGSEYVLLGVIGQPDVGVSGGGVYVLEAGFLAGRDSGFLFADGFESGTTQGWSSGSSGP